MLNFILMTFESIDLVQFYSNLYPFWFPLDFHDNVSY